MATYLVPALDQTPACIADWIGQLRERLGNDTLGLLVLLARWAAVLTRDMRSPPAFLPTRVLPIFLLVPCFP